MFNLHAGWALLACIMFFSNLTFSDPIIPGDNLMIEGMPTLDDAIIPKTSAYTNFIPNALVEWRGNSLVILARAPSGQTPQVNLVESPLGPKHPLTNFPDRISSITFQPVAGKYFIFSKDAQGGEWFQNFRFDMDTQKITQLTKGGETKNSLGIWSHRGDRVAYRTTIKDGTGKLALMNPENPETQTVIADFDRGETWQLVDWSPDDSKILAIESISVTENYLWIYDANQVNQKVRIAPTTTGEKISYDLAKFSPDGKSVWTITNKDSEFLRLAKLDPETGGYEFIVNDVESDVESFAISPRGDLMAFVTNDDGVSVLHLLNLETHEQKIVENIPKGVIYGLSWHDSGDRLSFDLSFARSPTDVFSLEISTGEIVRWTQTESTEVDLAQFVEPENISWQSFDDLKITGFLYQPPAKFSGKRPVMVIIHGGPESQTRPTFQGRLNYYLNEMGIALLFPNVRGSTGYGKSFVDLDNGYLRENSYKDIETLLAWIKKHPNLDGDRIMVTGGSYGGHMTLAVATRYNDQIACSVDIVGMSNLVTFLEHTEEYRRDLRRVEYGDERDPDMRRFLSNIAPMNHASNIKKPLFVIQGYNDPRVPYSESRQMVDTVKGNGTPVWFLTARDEGHGFAKKANQDFQFYSTIKFIDQYLIGPQKSSADARQDQNDSETIAK